MTTQIPFGADVKFAVNTEPRCACVLVLDVSGSMGTIVGEPGRDLGYTFERDGKTFRAVDGGVSRIDLLNDGLKAFRDELMTDSLAAQRVEVSIITFGDTVQEIQPFVTAGQFEPPTLKADGRTAMGEAILRAIDSVQAEKKRYFDNGIHYWRPWIFLITDGEPTDAWSQAAEAVHKGEKDKGFAFFAVGVEGADFATLGKIATRKPLSLKGMSFREMFEWLTNSLGKISQSQPGQEAGVSFEPTDGWANL